MAPTVPKSAPKSAPKRGKQPAANLPAASPNPVADGEYVQLFQTLWDCQRKFYSVPFSSRGSQKTDEWMQCVANCATCLTPSASMHVSMYPRAFGNQQQVTGHEFCTVWANKCLVNGVVPAPSHLATPPPPWGGGEAVVPRWVGVDKGVGGLCDWWG